LTNPNARVAFDLDGSGLPRKWGWITPKAAWLVYDPAGEGRITSGLQMFGNVMSGITPERERAHCASQRPSGSFWRDAVAFGCPAQLFYESQTADALQSVV
jgi:hypothetical protein